jgi:hypothetical protein
MRRWVFVVDPVAAAPTPVPPRKGEGDQNTGISESVSLRGGDRGGGQLAPALQPPYNFTVFSRSAFAITLTELSAIAAAAIIGDSSHPVSG